ncbi:MAG: hypothetical protein R2712_09560 [Vicinamibacterales bacterium]
MTRPAKGCFHQERLVLFGRWICLISGGFVVLNGMRILAGHAPAPAVGFHALATAAAGMVWWVASRGPMTIATMGTGRRRGHVACARASRRCRSGHTRAVRRAPARIRYR